MIYIVFSVLFQSTAGFFMKMAAMDIQDFTLINFIVNPYTILALFCFGFQAILWQLALKKHNLTYAYYFTSLRYIFTIALGYFVFSENVNLIHIAGLIMIIVGIMVFVKKGRENV